MVRVRNRDRSENPMIAADPITDCLHGRLWTGHFGHPRHRWQPSGYSLVQLSLCKPTGVPSDKGLRFQIARAGHQAHLSPFGY